MGSLLRMASRRESLPVRYTSRGRLAVSALVMVAAATSGGLPFSSRRCDAEHFEEVAGQVDVVLDTVGGDVLDRSAAVIRPGGTLVSVTAPPKARPADGRAVFFVVEPNRDQLAELARRVQQGRLTPKVGAVRPLAETRDAFLHKQGIPGKVIIQVA